MRYIVRTGVPWRWLPTNFPPCEAAYQQTRRWMAAGCFEAIVQDLRLLVRVASGRRAQPSTAIVDSRTLRSTEESGARAGVDGHKGVRGSKVHGVVDTLGALLGLSVTLANTAERHQVDALAQRVQEVTGETVEVLSADAGYTGVVTAAAAKRQGIQRIVVTRPEASRGFVLLSKRWVVERTFAWLSRFRRLARDDERLPTTLAALHFAAFVCLLLPKPLTLIGGSLHALMPRTVWIERTKAPLRVKDKLSYTVANSLALLSSRICAQAAVRYVPEMMCSTFFQSRGAPRPVF
jgi:transposase